MGDYKGLCACELKISELHNYVNKLVGQHVTRSNRGDHKANTSCKILYTGILMISQFKLGGRGAFDATQDLNPLLISKDCVYSVPTS